MFPSPEHQLAALALFAADTVIRAIRLRVLVPGGVSLWQAIAVNAYGDAAAAVTPARLGGDPARFVAFRRAGVDTPRSLAGLAVEALIDWVLLGVAAVLLALAFADTTATGVRRLVDLATGREARVLVAAVLALAAASALAARWYRRRHPTGSPPVGSVAVAWQRARQLGWRAVAIATALTAASMIARTAILPVLIAGHPAGTLAPGAVILGSFALLYGQLALPTPAGAGGVELGFIGGFAGTMSARELAALILAWRTYTLILGAALGGLLVARAALAGWTTRRRYSANSSVKVRSQL